MLEVVRTQAAVVRCLAEAASLDALSPPPGATAIRVASDELVLVGNPEDAARLVAAAKTDTDGLVIDQSGGWEAVTVAGEAADEAFRRVSALPLPADRPAVVQGAVAGLAAKAIAYSDRIVVLVSSTGADYLYERIRAAMAEVSL